MSITVARRRTYRSPAAGCSKHCYPNDAHYTNAMLFFLLEKCENLLHGERFSPISNKIYQEYFNETLTNIIVNFKQSATDGYVWTLFYHCLTDLITLDSLDFV